MGVMFILLPVALLFAAGALCAFIWAVRSGQLDDLVTPGLRILHDDDPPPDAKRSAGAPHRSRRDARRRDRDHRP
jgi:cbb3-type cytochrome oxidase maturation protein